MNPLVPAYLQAPPVAVINPQSATAGTYTTGWVDLAKFSRLYAILLIGAITGSGTVDAKFEQATSAAGAGAKDVDDTDITQLTGAGTDSNKQVTVEVRQAQVDVAGGFRWVRLSVTTATAASLAAAVVLGIGARFEPATQATTVDENVAA